MKQAVLVEFNRLEVEEAERPSIKSNEVLVEIDVCGICGSDLHIYAGNHPTIKTPIVMGHEFAGKVVEIGANVTKYKIGDYVAGIPGVGCRECEDCKSGKFNLCRSLKVIGGFYSGAFANYTAVPDENLIHIPAHFTATQGAMIESVAVAVHTARRFQQVEGKAIAVFGAGPIGLLTVQALKALGARLVISSDPIEGRRAIAKRMGADVVINPMSENVEETIKALVGDIGLDGAVDCAGLELTVNQAIACTKNGGEIVITALFTGTPVIPLRMIQRNEKKIIGTQMYVREDFEIAIQLMQDNKINIDEMVTHRFDLDDISDAFKLATSRSPEVGKMVIDLK